ncbi:hypothetical protein K1719_043445 [Acacia pycnantha]|nr:hypothetical protein K1719_043445 [Acacia pycnantha]
MQITGFLIEVTGFLNEVKFKTVPCHYSLNLLLVKLKQSSTHKQVGAAIYKECQRHCPFVIEAITALLEPASVAKAIILLSPRDPSGRGINSHQTFLMSATVVFI